MPVRVTLDVMLARRKMRARDVAERIGLSETQLSLLRTGKVRGMRFDTLSKLCLVLECDARRHPRVRPKRSRPKLKRRLAGC